jgi:outer membrane protein TolC
MKKMIGVFTGLFLAGIAHGQSLESYIGEAEANNPEVQAFEIKYALSKERVEEADALPNTELSAGVFVSEPETRTGAQKARFSVRQMLPWFGTITARENYANSLAEVDYLDIAITKRKLRLEVSRAYYTLFEISRKQEVLEKNIELLRTYEALALTSVEVGNASAVDVLRLQIRQNELEEGKLVLDQQYRAEQIAFNKLLDRDAEVAVRLPDTLSLQEAIAQEQGDLEIHPELEKYDRLYESVTQSEALNQKETQPYLGLGLDYIPVAERTDVDFSDNGKDVLMPMVSLSIPIFNNNFSSRSAQNALRQEELLAQKSSRKNLLESLLGGAVGAREAAKIKHETQLKNLERARDAEDILLKKYQTGTIDFGEVLDIQELQLKFEMARITAIKDYYEQTAIINYLSGR